MNLRIIRKQADAVNGSLEEWLKDEYPLVADKLPRP
jgi:hypothetical protein